MKSYIVILQLGYTEESYTNLISYLKSANTWARPMKNTWIIKTPKTSAEIRDGINTRININMGDKIIILSVENYDWATNNIDRVVTDWMKNNL